MRTFLWGLIKILLASLLAGWLLGILGISTDSILKTANLSPQDVIECINQTLAWMTPRLTLGAVFVLPVWLLTYLFMPSAKV